MKTIAPCLWFNMQAEDAVNFYVSVFPNSRILETSRYPAGGHMPEGTALTIDFELNGQRMQALNGGPEFTFSEAISLTIACESQAEVDDLWSKLTADGGEESQCGWLKDKFGLSWQVVPQRLNEMMATKDPAAFKRLYDAIMPMQKLDLAALERAFAGT